MWEIPEGIIGKYLSSSLMAIESWLKQWGSERYMQAVEFHQIARSLVNTDSHSHHKLNTPK